MKKNKIKKLLHYSGSAMPPIYQQSTVIFDRLEDLEQTHYNYGRKGTLTNRALENKINELEGAQRTFITQSGASAIYLALLALVQKGDHILVCETAYRPTLNFCEHFLHHFGIEVTYFAGDAGSEIEKLIKPNTRLIFMESPSSLFFEIQDIKAIVKLARAKKIQTIMDNTYAASLLFKPLDYGVDISLLSASKYYSGHADIIMGVVSTRNQEIAEKIGNAFNLLGYHTSPFDCYQVYRGLETLKVRLQSQSSSAKKVAQFLENHSEVGLVIYPTLDSYPQNKRFKQYFKQPNGLITFCLHQKYTLTEVRKLVNSLQCFGIGYSWGGCESIVMLYSDKTHRPEKYSEPHSFIRLSIGAEKSKMLIEDLNHALEQIKK